MSPPLTEADAARVREGIAAAVVGGPEALRHGLEHDPRSFLTLVAAARVGAEESDRLLRQAVLGARQAGHSWEVIGRLLDVSRQAAQQRFAPRDAGTAAAPDRRVITGVTAFTEMARLAVEGEQGWHLVDFGPLYLVVERSDQAWEHKRLTMPPKPVQRRLAAQGWTDAGAWFPFRYFKRPAVRASTA